MSFRRLAPALAVGIVSMLTLSAISAWQWRELVAPSWDLGIFTQLADAYAHLRAPIVPIKGEGYNLLGDHFHPILILLGPVYRLFPSALTLLVVQNALFAASAALLTYRIRRHVPTWAAVLLGLVAGTGWATQTATSAQFHEIAFAVPLLTLALTSYLDDRPAAAAGWAAPLVFVKEDLGITVALFGLVLAWRWWRDRDRAWAGAGAALSAWGAAWFVLTVAVLLPALNPSGHYDYTERVGGLLTVFTPGTKWLLVALLIVTAGGIGLSSPLLALVVPTLAWRFVGDVEYYWWIGWHYDVLLVPILLAALIDGARRLRRFGYRRVLSVGVAASLASTLVVFGDMPITRIGVEDHSAHRRDVAARIERLVARGGDRPRVVTDQTLMARLVPVATVYWVAERKAVPDFVVLDAYSGAWGGAPPDAVTWAEENYGGTYERVLHDGGFDVAEKAP